MSDRFSLNRREFLQRLLALPVAGAVLGVTGCRALTADPASTPTAATEARQRPTAAPTEIPARATPTPEGTATPDGQTRPTVFMTKTISTAGLMAVYQALGHPATGKVAVKISSGEPGGHHYLAPDLIAPLVKAVNGTIVECNTAYGGGRANTASHQRVMQEHGFAAIAPVDIMDADGTMNLPISEGKHLKENVVGSHFANYDFVVNLAHFKGHAMAGFGGVIKNMSIGIAAQAGKCLIHTAGASRTSIWGGDQDSFLESMAEAAKGVADFLGENILYINVMNNLSVDCDCDSHPAAPTMKDIGILASLDPVALDQACVDLVYAAPDGKDLVARMESRHGIHTLEHAEQIGLGKRTYEVVNLDEKNS